MAQLTRDGDLLLLTLTPAEKLEGAHGNIHVSVSSVQSITVVDDVIHAVRGIRAPGTRIPGILAIGTFWANEGTSFAVVHHQNTRGVRVNLTGQRFDALIVGSDHPEQLVASLGF